MNPIGHLSLRSILDRVVAGLRTVLIPDEVSGAVCEMVLIPHFIIPQGTWEDGNFPPEDLHLGGFLVDKYSCSFKTASPASMGCAPGLVVTEDDGNVAVSRPFVQPWRRISLGSAHHACANRKIFGGQRCHLMTAYEWATLAYLFKLLATEVYGNTAGGRDSRHPASMEYKGVVVPQWVSDAAWLCGSGPAVTSLPGAACGIFDLVGNLWEWISVQVLDDGLYYHQKVAAIDDADGITAADTEIAIDGVQEPENWPSSGYATIQFDGVHAAEIIWYANFVDNGGGNYALTGCLRGQQGTPASAHDDDAPMLQTTAHCVVPGGYRGEISNGGLNNTDNPATFTYDEFYRGPSGPTAPAPDDVLRCENELLQVTTVVANSLTVTRGFGGTTPAAHAQGKTFARLAPTSILTQEISVVGGVLSVKQKGYIQTLWKPTPGMTAGKFMAFPLLCAPAAAGEYLDKFVYNHGDSLAACRGGGYLDASDPSVSPFALAVRPQTAAYDIGFRAAFWLEHTQLKQFGIAY
jgi:hypothetical protein